MTKKLHLGCGKTYLPGYTNLDIDRDSVADSIQDCKDLSSIETASVDTIYCSHLFEHFYQYDALSILKGWHRLLAPGGVLRLAVPDFVSVTKVYEQTKDLELLRGCLYGRGTRFADCDQVPHRTIYDFFALKSLLEDAGFVGVQTWDWRDFFSGELLGIDDHSQAYIPHMDKEDGILMSLNVEGFIAK